MTSTKKQKRSLFSRNRLVLIIAMAMCLVLLTTNIVTVALLIQVHKSNAQLNDTPTVIDEIVENMTIDKFSCPVPEKYRYNISSKQGLRDALSIVNGGGEIISTGQKWHQGLDIACPDRTEIYADKDGYVSICYPGFLNGKIWRGHPVYGSCLIINHYDGTISLYAHLSMTLVKEGEYVTRGQNIALSGGVRGRRASGQSTGPHLHYAVYLNTDSIFTK